MFGQGKVIEELKAKLAKYENGEEEAKRKAVLDEYEERLKRFHEQAEVKDKEWRKQVTDLQATEKVLKKKFDDEKALAFKTMELEFKQKHMEDINKVRQEYDQKLLKANEEHFEKLKQSLAKLHEEGNAQTKFTEKIALSFMERIKDTGSTPALEAPTERRSRRT